MQTYDFAKTHASMIFALDVATWMEYRLCISASVSALCINVRRISRKLGHQPGIPYSGRFAAPFFLRSIHPYEVWH
jgi:hypothetical protein